MIRYWLIPILLCAGLETRTFAATVGDAQSVAVARVDHNGIQVNTSNDDARLENDEQIANTPATSFFTWYSSNTVHSLPADLGRRPRVFARAAGTSSTHAVINRSAAWSTKIAALCNQCLRLPSWSAHAPRESCRHAETHFGSQCWGFSAVGYLTKSFECNWATNG